MKRITVAVTLGDDSWPSQRELRGIKAAMITAAIEKATLSDLSMVALDAKVGTVRKKP